MKIALLGYGKMGKTIEAMATAAGHQVIVKIHSSNIEQRNNLQGADVAIEFTNPQAAMENLKACFDQQVPVVCGTTGWLNHKDEMETYCFQKKGAFFYASNFSLGVNLFFKLNQWLAGKMNRYPAYDINVEEIHHTQKKDTPSGTAITLAEDILKVVSRKKNWSDKKNANPESLVISSLREDPTPGTHTVRYTSPVDSIEIKHAAHSREGFAAGALLASEWLKDKKGIFGMDDLLKF